MYQRVKELQLQFFFLQHPQLSQKRHEQLALSEVLFSKMFFCKLIKKTFGCKVFSSITKFLKVSVNITLFTVGHHTLTVFTMQIIPVQNTYFS